MATAIWKRLEKRTLRLLGRYLHADQTDGGTKCVLAGCQVDAVGIFGSVAIVFECKTTHAKKVINLSHAIDVIAGRRTAIRAALRHRYGKHIRTIRFIVIAHNVTRISGSGRRKRKPADIRVWTPKYFDAVESLARAINRRALPYILREMGIKNLAKASGIKGGTEVFPALRVRLKKNTFLYSFFAPASVLLDVGYVARLEMAEGDAYQRLLRGSRLKDIAEYINKEETFKNSVVISLPKAAVFTCFRKTSVAEVGTLRLPRIPASVWIIDGQHRIYGYAKAKESLIQKPISVVAVRTSSMLDQARIFVDINVNQKPVDKNLVWDLYFRLNPDQYTGVVSQLVRDLATSRSSPLHGKIYVPGLTTSGRSSYRIYMANVCDAIIRHGILQAALGIPQSATLDRLKPETILAAERLVSSRFRRFYKALLAVRPSLPQTRSISRFMLSNNGIAVFLRIFKETLLYWHSAPSQALLRKTLRKPLKRYCAHTDLPNIERNTSSEGGRDAAATAILLEMRKEKELSAFAEERLKAAKKLVREDEFLKTLRYCEKSLRSMLRQELSRDCKDWWKVRVPDDVKDAVGKKPQAKDPDADPMDLLDINHYMRIISHNWKDHFEWYYEKAGRDKNWLSMEFQELSRLRNAVFHFHGTAAASEAETWRLRFLTEDILVPLRKTRPATVTGSTVPLADAASA
jgi:DGQHR domain-containing protein